MIQHVGIALIQAQTVLVAQQDLHQQILYQEILMLINVFVLKVPMTLYNLIAQHVIIDVQYVQDLPALQLIANNANQEDN